MDFVDHTDQENEVRPLKSVVENPSQKTMRAAVPPAVLIMAFDTRSAGLRHSSAMTANRELPRYLDSDSQNGVFQQALIRNHAIGIGEHTRPRVFRLAPRRSDGAV
jgi:hypothetical protein